MRRRPGGVRAAAWLLAGLATFSPAERSKLQADRNVGLAALEEDDLPEAARRFEELRRLAPNDPLGFADGAIVALRQKDYAAADRLLQEALRLAPSDPSVLAIEGKRRELSGDAAGAIAA